MYDQKHMWYLEIKRASVRQRLAVLKLESLFLYAVTCVTHAKDVLITSIGGQASAEYAFSARLLDSFWRDFPGSLAFDFIRNLGRQAEQTVTAALGEQPDRHFLTLPGAEPLLWGTVYAMSIQGGPDSVSLAYDAIDKAYFSYLHSFRLPRWTI